MSARELLEKDGSLPVELRKVELENGRVTKTFAVVADYGWAESILCEGCYERDADAIVAALNEAIGKGA